MDSVKAPPDEGDSVEASQAELLADHLERALLDSTVQDTHIFLARSQILLVVIGMISELRRPVALVIVQD